MFKSIMVKLCILMVLIGSSLGLPAKANSPSLLCSQVNGTYMGPVILDYTIQGNSNSPFNVGEIITVYATGTATKVDVEIPQGTVVGTASRGGSFSYQIPISGIYTLNIANNTGAGYVEGTLTCSVAPVIPIEEPFLPGDDRLNHNTSDRAAPIAVYCSTGDISLLRIDPVSAQGVDEFTVSLTDINAAGIPSEGALTLAERNWVLLSRLADGRFQVNTHYADGKDYIIVWEECDFATLVHLAR